MSGSDVFETMQRQITVLSVATQGAHADLGELVSGKKAGRESAEERTIACNLGLAMDDMAVVKNHNPFAVNDAIFAKVHDYDWREMNKTGCSLVWGHPQGPTLTRMLIEGLEEAVDLGGGTLSAFGQADVFRTRES